MALRDFSDKDIAVLRELVSDHLNRQKNTNRRGASGGPGDAFQEMELQIALPPEDGLPGLTRGGESIGTSSASLPEPGDVPGSAECNIYWIDTNGALADTGYTETVYNLAETAFAYDWIIIAKTKYGNWVVIAGTIDC